MLKDREMFFRYHRMTPNRFEHLLSLVEDKITKKETRLRKPATMTVVYWQIRKWV